MNKTSRILGISLLTLSAMAMAGTAGVTIKRTPKEGQELKYTLKANLDFSGQAITFTGTVIEKILKVTPDGYEVEESQVDGKINMGGNEMDAPTGGTSKTVYGAMGLVKEITGEQADANAYRMANLGVLVEPGKELNIGDTWSHEYKADVKTGAVAAKADYKLVAEEKIGDWETYKIKADVKETEGSDPASSDATMWVNKADFSLVKLEAKWVNAPFPGAPAPITANVVMERK